MRLAPMRSRCVNVLYSYLSRPVAEISRRTRSDRTYTRSWWEREISFDVFRHRNVLPGGSNTCAEVFRSFLTWKRASRHFFFAFQCVKCQIHRLWSTQLFVITIYLKLKLLSVNGLNNDKRLLWMCSKYAFSISEILDDALCLSFSQSVSANVIVFSIPPSLV